MTDVIVIAGAPGSGKSTVAAALREELDSPLFEFGWIPEFRRTRTGSLSYPEEAAFAFENLVLVVWRSYGDSSSPDPRGEAPTTRAGIHENPLTFAGLGDLVNFGW